MGVEQTPNGHDGRVGNIRHFKCKRGYGEIVPISNILHKLSASDLTKKMQDIITLCLDRFNLYIEAVDERDSAIVERNQIIKMQQQEIRRLNQLNNNNTNSKMSGQMDLATPSPLQERLSGGSLDDSDKGNIYENGLGSPISYSIDNNNKQKKKKSKVQKQRAVYSKYPTNTFSNGTGASMSSSFEDDDYKPPYDDDQKMQYQQPSMALKQSVTFQSYGHAGHKMKMIQKTSKKKPKIRSQRSNSLIVSSSSRSIKSSQSSQSLKNNTPRLRRKRSRSFSAKPNQPRHQKMHQVNQVYFQSNHPHLNVIPNDHMSPINPHKLPHSVPTPNNNMSPPQVYSMEMAMDSASPPSPHLLSPKNGMMHCIPYQSNHLPTLNQYAASYDVYPSNGHNQKHSPSVTPKTKPMQYSKSHHNGSANHRQFNKYPHPEMRQMNGNNVKQPNFNRRRRSVSMDDYEF